MASYLEMARAALAASEGVTPRHPEREPVATPPPPRADITSYEINEGNEIRRAALRRVIVASPDLRVLLGLPDEPLTVSFDLSVPFDHRACSAALLRCPDDTVH